MKLFLLLPRGKAKSSIRVYTRSTETLQESLTLLGATGAKRSRHHLESLKTDRKKLDPRKERRLPSFFGKAVSSKVGSSEECRSHTPCGDIASLTSRPMP